MSQALETLIFAMLLDLKRRSPFWARALDVVVLFLLAESKFVNQKVAMRLLQRMGYAPDLAEDGREAIAAVERQPYNLVLMDMQMPDVDGLEASRHITSRWAAAHRGDDGQRHAGGSRGVPGGGHG